MGGANVDAERSIRRVGALAVPAPKRRFEEHHRVPPTALELIQADLHFVRVDDRCVNRSSEPLQELSQVLGSLVVHQSSNEQ